MNMNKITMAIWGAIIFILWGLIIFIAYQEKLKGQDDVLDKIKAELKTVTARYIDKNNIDLDYNESYKVFIDDLKESNYIKDENKIKEYCIDSIVYTKGLIKDDYLFNIECKEE